MRRFREQAATFAAKGGWTAVDACALSIKALGAERVAIASKWSDDVNATLAGTLNRLGIEVVGSVGVAHDMDQITGDYESGAQTAWTLAHAAMESMPEADMVFLAGAAWLTLHLVEALERELGVPVVTGLQSTNWLALNLVEAFTPREGQGSLLRRVLDRRLLDDLGIDG